MYETSQADRLVILARHAVTPANQAKYAGSAESRVQGLSPEMPIDEVEGFVQAHALGMAVGRLAGLHNLKIVEVHTASTVRATTTRDVALDHVFNVPVALPDTQLQEQSKGDLEDMLRSQAYPDEATRAAAANNWDFRHGTRESGGETPREAGKRWVAWFNQVVAQPNFQPRTDPEQPIPTLLVFGHNLITACGVTLLTHDEADTLPPPSDRTFKVDNATGLLLAENEARWSVLPERLTPLPEEIEAARIYASNHNA